MTLSELRVDVVILACTISAGVHAALVPAHFSEGAGPGIGFAVAALAAVVCGVVLTRNPSRHSLLAAAAVLAGLIVSYLVVLTTGLPVLHPDREPVEGLALFTKAVEAVGLVVAASAARLPSPVLFQPKGTLT